MAGFRPRTDTEHREHQRKYQQCSTKTARAQFIKEFATRFSELSRLPYFDMCRMIVIDPMHNLYLGKLVQLMLYSLLLMCSGLGVVKTHFYHIWVQHKILRKTKELRRLHAILSEVRILLVSFLREFPTCTLAVYACTAWPFAKLDRRTSRWIAHS